MSVIEERNLGPYRLVEQIGAGGMGVVYRAQHVKLGSEAAVKILPINFAGHREILERFDREAVKAAALEHPNILRVWDYGEEGGTPYLVMPYLRGGTLQARLKRGPLPQEEIAALLGQMAAALDYAHARGIVHRDVKPANMLLDERGHLYLSDFGIAKALEEARELTGTNVVVGTPEYMAPEQLDGQADWRSDLYALGVILYRMLTGRVPFGGNSSLQVLMKHLHEPLPLSPLRGRVPALPASVERVMQRALAKVPDERYQSGQALVEAYNAALAGRDDPAATAPDEPGGERAAPQHTPAPDTWTLLPVFRRAGTRRTLFVAGLVALIVVLLLGVTGAYTWWPSGGNVSNAQTLEIAPTAATQNVTDPSTATAANLQVGPSTVAATVAAPSSATPALRAGVPTTPRATTAAGVARDGSTPAVAVAYDAFAPYYPVRIAQLQGYTQRRGIALRQVPFDLNGQNSYTEEERRQALLDGTFDILLTTLNSFALFGDERAGKVIAIVDESAGADKIVARAPIGRVNDLRGKRIAFSSGSVGEFFLYASLNLAGLSVGDVALVPAKSVDEAVGLFNSGAVDAVVGWEPSIAAALQQPGTRTLIGSDNYRAILDVIVVSTKALAEKPDAIQAFLDSWFEAVKLTTDDPGAAGAAVVQSGDSAWTGVTRPAEFAEQLGLVAQATLAQNQFALRDPGTLGGRIREIQGVWRAGGKRVTEIDPAHLLDTRFVQRSATKPELLSTRPPVNDSFVLTSTIQLPQLTPEQLGRSQAVAELPLKFIEFAPNSMTLTARGKKDLLDQVVPVLKQTPGLYLRVDGSAAKLPEDGDQQHEAFARNRARAVISFLIGQGIDPNRLIEGYLKPQFPNSLEEAERVQDRKVVFTLVQPSGR